MDLNVKKWRRARGMSRKDRGLDLSIEAWIDGRKRSRISGSRLVAGFCWLYGTKSVKGAPFLPRAQVLTVLYIKVTLFSFFKLVSCVPFFLLLKMKRGKKKERHPFDLLINE